MKSRNLLLLGTLAAGCAEKPEPGSSYPYESYESPDGSGGGAEETPDGDRPSDEEILNNARWDVYSYALNQAVTGDFEDTWYADVASDDPMVNQDARTDLIVDIPLDVEEGDNPDNKQFSVVTGLVEDCDFTDLDEVQHPLDVEMPYDVTRFSGSDWYSFDYDGGRIGVDNHGDQIGIMVVPFTWARENDSVASVHAVPTLAVTCFELYGDGLEVHYFFPVN